MLMAFSSEQHGPCEGCTRTVDQGSALSIRQAPVQSHSEQQDGQHAVPPAPKREDDQHFVGAAWGLYKATTWWRPLAIGGSILGALVLLLWWVAVSSVDGVTNIAANLALHAIGIAVLLLVLLVPSLGRGVDRRVAEQPRHGA
jgi:hypothetical protein